MSVFPHSHVGEWLLFWFLLLFGHEYFHTECEYQAAKKQTFYFSDQTDFSEHSHCVQTHQTVMMDVRSRRHIRIPQQQR